MFRRAEPDLRWRFSHADLAVVVTVIGLIAGRMADDRVFAPEEKDEG